MSKQIMKKKILYCITKANWGGAQRYVYDLATSLPKDSYEPIVLLGSDGFLNQKLQSVNIRTIVLGDFFRDVNILKDFSALIKLIKIFKKEKPNVIHLNSSKMGFLGALAGRLAGIKKIIFTGHGWAFNEDRSKWQKRIICLLHLATIALAHKTIAVSLQTKKQVAGNAYLAKRIEIIKNGIGNINFLEKQVARNFILGKLPADLDLKDRLWLGTISELHKNKGLKYVIEAIHELETLTEDKSELPILIIIGEGERREKLQERINRYNLEDTVFLIGRIEEAEKYLKAFNIFTLTSITEALPYALLEAGRAGLPIIASAVGGIPEIIDDMTSGILVRPKEPEEIKKAIDFLLKNPGKMVTFGQNIKEKIESDFTKDEMVKKTIELYN